MKISLNQQIEEVETELMMRSHVYPRQVAAGKMRKSEADYRTARMQAVLTTLKWLRDHEAQIKARLAQPLGQNDNGSDA